MDGQKGRCVTHARRAAVGDFQFLQLVPFCFLISAHNLHFWLPAWLPCDAGVAVFDGDDSHC